MSIHGPVRVFRWRPEAGGLLALGPSSRVPFCRGPYLCVYIYIYINVYLDIRFVYSCVQLFM